MFMRSYMKGHVFFYKGPYHYYSCVSNDIIDDVIKFAKLSVADGTETG